MRNFLLLCLTVLLLAGCGGVFQSSKKTDPVFGYYKIGKPYKISGKWYRPHVDYDYEEVGIASWYGKQFHGKPTANGAVFNMNAVSAAHRTLPLPSYVLVENLRNGKKLKILVNDRGPFYNNRIIDLSRQAAKRLGVLKRGTAKVKVTILAHESSLLATRLQNAKGSEYAGVIPKASPTGKIKTAALSPTQKRGAKGWRNSAEAAETNTASLQAEPQQQAPERQAVVAGDKIYIQVGAYSRYANAVGVQQKLHNLGNVELWQTQGNPALYRVRLGPFAKLMDATDFLGQVKTAGFNDAQVVVVKPSSN